MLYSLLIEYFIFRRKVKTSRPLLQMLLFGDEEDQDDMRSKNIRQTGSKTKLLKMSFTNLLI